MRAPTLTTVLGRVWVGLPSGFALAVLALAVLGTAYPAAAQERKTRDMLVREDRANVEGNGFWIYNDLPGAFGKAKETGKPLLVVFRCIPCEACAKLDADIVERDPKVRELLQKFVCLRIVHANNLDLGLFQFDYDQSFAAFFMNADKTIYGRYGTRSHQTKSEDDVSLEGFAKALTAALELHKSYPGNASSLAGKSSQDKPAHAVPEQYVQLRGKYTGKLDYEGKLAQSCIHCHQVGEAQRHEFRAAGKPLPDKLLFPYPHPKAFGLVMDPKEKATVKRIVPGSQAERDGFQAGDEIVSLAGQTLLSLADIQWVLHNAPAEGKLTAVVHRKGQAAPPAERQLTLEKGWRQRDDLSWRSTSWSLRRMTTGGMVLEDVPEEARRKAGVADDTMALRVRYMGQYGGPHGLAKQTGFRVGDIIVSVDGRAEPMRETDLFALLVQKKPSEQVPFTVLREGKRQELTLRMQD
jgi:serine protease Do